MRSPDPRLAPRHRLLNAAGASLRRAGLARLPLDADALHEAAVRSVGHDDFGDPHYREGLAALLAAVPDADPTFFGRWALRRVALEGLETRLRLRRAAAAGAPDPPGSPLRPPLIVVGLPRSGTTLLHRLLACDPAGRAPPRWELQHPLPRRPGDGPARRRRAVALAMATHRRLVPELDRLHYTRADTPEECMNGLVATFRTPFFWVVAPVHGYMAWYAGADRRPKYREYRALLRILQATDPDRHLVLKSPSHTDALEELVEAVPEARLVQTHRDPAAVAASHLSLLYALHRATARRLDVPRLARTDLAWLRLAAERSLAFDAAHPGRVLHLRYDDLVRDPEAAVRRVHAHAGLPLTPEHETALRGWLRANPQDRHGRHRYDPAEFGLDEAELRAGFAAYAARFLAA